jgi:hypothetical protein
MDDIDKARVERIGNILHLQKGFLCRCGKDDCKCCQRQFLYDMVERLLKRANVRTLPPRAIGPTAHVGNTEEQKRPIYPAGHS